MTHAFKWGMIFSITQFLWLTLEFVMGYHTVRIAQHILISNMFVIPAIAIMVLAIRNFKLETNVSSYKDLLLSGVYVSLVVAMLSPVVQLVFFYGINPNFFETFIAYAMQHGNHTREEAEAYFNIKSYIVQGISGAVIMGIITSAIVAIFFTRKKQSID